MNSFMIDQIDNDARRVLDAADILLTGKYAIKTVTVIECADDVTEGVLREALGAHVLEYQPKTAHPGEKNCEICGKPFFPVHARQKMCGDKKCAEEKNRQYSREFRERNKKIDVEQPAGEVPLA
jgi:hypothetical protein